MAQYDTIAADYRQSKELPFRAAIERATFFRLIGDLRGKTVYDLACGEGHYTRRMKQAGAAGVTGVDISGGMIRLAERQERERPLGVRYVCSDAADFDPPEPADRVAAMFLLHYAESREKLSRFLAVIWRALVPGGRLVGFLDNVTEPPDGRRSWRKYGFERAFRAPRPEGPEEGDAVVYRFGTADGGAFSFENVYWKPETYETAFQETGFRDFRWEAPRLAPTERGNPFWDDFLEHPPIIPFSATRPASSA